MNFYKIQLTDSDVGTKTHSLLDILKLKYPALYRRELVRRNLKETTDPKLTSAELAGIVQDYTNQTEILYKIHKLPLFIIVTKNEDSSLTEVTTSTTLYSANISTLEKNLIPNEYVRTYLDESKNYSKALTKFFENTDTKVAVKISHID